jgi:hypothetical protein
LHWRKNYKMDRKYFNKWCYICDSKFKVHFTDAETAAIKAHYGTLAKYPRNNQMCLICQLKFMTLLLRAPCKCKKCNDFFWMYKTHPKYNQAKEMFLEKKRFWQDYCPKCDTIYQKSYKLQCLNPKPKAEMRLPEDGYFLYACKYIETTKEKTVKKKK